MKFKAENNFFGRDFLNNIDSYDTGSTRYNLTVRKKARRSKVDKPRGSHYYKIDGNIEIRDCVRRIDLTLGGGTRTKKEFIRLLSTKRKLLTLTQLLQEQLDIVEAVIDQDPYFLDLAVKEIREKYSK